MCQKAIPYDCLSKTWHVIVYYTWYLGLYYGTPMITTSRREKGDRRRVSDHDGRSSVSHTYYGSPSKCVSGGKKRGRRKVRDYDGRSHFGQRFPRALQTLLLLSPLLANLMVSPKWKHCIRHPPNEGPPRISHDAEMRADKKTRLRTAKERTAGPTELVFAFILFSSLPFALLCFGVVRASYALHDKCTIQYERAL